MKKSKCLLTRREREYYWSIMNNDHIDTTNIMGAEDNSALPETENPEGNKRKEFLEMARLRTIKAAKGLGYMATSLVILAPSSYLSEISESTGDWAAGAGYLVSLAAGLGVASIGAGRLVNAQTASAEEIKAEAGKKKNKNKAINE